MQCNAICISLKVKPLNGFRSHCIWPRIESNGNKVAKELRKKKHNTHKHFHRKNSSIWYLLLFYYV